MFTLDEILIATGAEVIGDNIDGDFRISTDTRTISKGEIYLPLKGENFDGENFINKAINAGAVGAFCTKKHENLDCLLLKVEDTLQAYLKLAQFYKEKVAPKTIAITGSCGKTTTKEMAFCVASNNFKTHKTSKNFNNEIGFCKTVLDMPIDTQVLILEMGMRGIGEIELIAKYAKPDISIIANVGTAHIGRLGSREKIAKAKCEIVKFHNQNSIVIAHNDKLLKNVLDPIDIKKVYFSIEDASILEKKVGYSKFNYKNHVYQLNIEGEYNIQNSLITIEMGLALGMKEEDIAKGLLAYKPIEKRWEMKEIKGFKVINDSYNANPESMKSVINTVLTLYEPPILFVLGNMGELGENEIKYHKEIGKYLVSNNKQGVETVTVGNLGLEISNVLNQNNIPSKNFNDNLETSRYILANTEFGTTIILKASRSMKFEEIVEQLEKI